MSSTFSEAAAALFFRDLGDFPPTGSAGSTGPSSAGSTPCPSVGLGPDWEGSGRVVGSKIPEGSVIPFFLGSIATAQHLRRQGLVGGRPGAFGGVLEDGHPPRVGLLKLDRARDRRGEDEGPE